MKERHPPFFQTGVLSFHARNDGVNLPSANRIKHPRFRERMCHSMNYMTVLDAAKKWDITVRRVQRLCAENRIAGVCRFGRSFMIPADAEKPAVARIKSGKYRKDPTKE